MQNLSYKQIRLSAALIAAVVAVVFVAPEVRADLLTGDLFTIEYDSGYRAVAEHTRAVLEEAVAEFEPLLPVGERPIHIKIVAAPDEFKRYAVHFSGLTISGLAKPSEDFIVVQAPGLGPPGSDYPGTLRHELVHLLVYRNVNPAYMPTWLNEGIAMSLANEYRWQAPLLIARMFVQNRIIPYHQLDRAFFSPTGQEQFGDAYAQSLSMTRHLRDRLGEERFWQMMRAMRTMPFPQALQEQTGMTVLQFWNEYERSLWKFALIAAMASGFFFQPAAILVILAYLRRRHIAKGLYRRWEEEDAEAAAEAAAGRGHILHWDEVVEDPDAWKGEAYEEEDDD